MKRLVFSDRFRADWYVRVYLCPSTSQPSLVTTSSQRAYVYLPSSTTYFDITPLPNGFCVSCNCGRNGWELGVRAGRPFLKRFSKTCRPPLFP